MKTIKVLFVCLGNICRSPMAEAIFNHKIAERGLTDYLESDSAGTANYHIGKAADCRTISALERMGIHINHKARQVSSKDLSYYDYVLAMDIDNLRMLQTLAKADQELGGRLYLMRDFEAVPDRPASTLKAATAEDRGFSSAGLSVPDPYYGGEEGFREVYEILERSLANFIDYVCREHKLPSHV